MKIYSNLCLKQHKNPYWIQNISCFSNAFQINLSSEFHQIRNPSWQTTPILRMNSLHRTFFVCIFDPQMWNLKVFKSGIIELGKRLMTGFLMCLFIAALTSTDEWNWFGWKRVITFLGKPLGWQIENSKRIRCVLWVSNITWW